MKKIIPFLYIMLTSGCSTVSGVGQEISMALSSIQSEPPAPVYVTPMFYEKMSCDQLASVIDDLGYFSSEMKKHLERRGGDMVEPENTKINENSKVVSYIRDKNIPVEPRWTVYEGFVNAWGHYEAAYKAQNIKKCQINDEYNLVPWQTVPFDLEFRWTK